jgi:hypothetical protein
VARSWHNACRLQSSSPYRIMLPTFDDIIKADVHYDNEKIDHMTTTYIRALLGSPYLRPSIIETSHSSIDGHGCFNVMHWHMLAPHRHTCQQLHIRLSESRLGKSHMYDDMVGGLASLLSIDNEHLTDLQLKASSMDACVDIISTLLSGQQLNYPSSLKQKEDAKESKTTEVRLSSSIALPPSLIKLQLEPVDLHHIGIAASRGAFKQLQVLQLGFRSPDGVIAYNNRVSTPFPVDVLKQIVNGTSHELIEVTTPRNFPLHHAFRDLTTPMLSD